MTIDDDAAGSKTDENGQTGSDTGKIKLFISYSRMDRERVGALYDALVGDDDLTVFRDTDDILPTEEWKPRLEGLIRASDTIIFALSPKSVASEICAWELDLAESLNKRIIPIVVEDVDGNVPEAVSKLNYIFLTERDRLETALRRIGAALRIDIDWIREHTRLADLALRWDQAQKLGAQPLRGRELEEAERWLAKQPNSAPSPTALHRDYIFESRRRSTRRQRQLVLVSLAAIAVFGALAVFAFMQRQVAVDNEVLATQNEQRAVRNEARAKQQLNEALKNQSLFLAAQSKLQLEAGNPVEAAILALAGLPDRSSADEIQNGRPVVAATVEMLKQAQRPILEKEILYLHKSPTSLLVGPNGRYLATGSRPRPFQMTLYDLENRRILAIAEGVSSLHGQSIMAFDPAGTFFVTGSTSGSIRIYTLEPFRKGREIQVSESALQSISVLPGGLRILVASADDVTRTIDLRSGAVLAEFPGAIAVASSDGSKIMTITTNGVFRSFNAGTGKEIGRSGPWRRLANNVAQLNVSADNKRMVVRTGFAIWIYNTDTLKVEGRMEEDRTGALSFSTAGITADGAWLFFAGNEMTIIDLQNGETVADYGEQDAVFDIAFQADNKAVLTSGGDGTLRLWDPTTKDVLARLNGHQKPVLQGRLLPGGSQVVSTSSDGTVRLWSLPDRQAQKTVIREMEGEGAILSPDKSLLAVGGAGLFDFASGKVIQLPEPTAEYFDFHAFSDDSAWLLATYWDEMEDGSNPREPCLIDLRSNTARCFGEGFIYSAAMTSSGHLIAVGGDRGIMIYDARTGARVAHIDASGPASDYSYGVRDLVFSPDGGKLLVKKSGDNVLIYDVSLSQEAIRLQGETEKLKDARFQVTADRIIGLTESREPRINAWDATTGEQVFTRRLPEELGNNEFTLSQTEKFVSVVGYASNGVFLFDALTGEPKAELKSEEGADVPGDVTFSTDDSRLMVTQDRDAHVWDLSTFTKTDVLSHRGNADNSIVIFKAFSNDNKTATTWSWDGPRHWRLFDDIQALVDHAKFVLPRCLTLDQRKQLALPENRPDWCARLGKWPESFANPVPEKP